MILSKQFEFEAAHKLINYNGKCANLHGHTYKLIVKIEGTPNTASGMIIDFVEMKKIVNTNVIEKLDHAYTNDLLAQPTAENIIVWIWNAVKADFEKQNCKLYELELFETRTSSVIYRGE